MLKKFCVLVSCMMILSGSLFANDQLVFSVDLIRHGDRTPVTPLAKMNFNFKEGNGELTKLGREQEKKLGELLRDKYINQSHLLSQKYNPNDLYIRSTNFPRTINSAEAILSGLYPLSDRPVQQQIPIYTLPLEKDDLLLVKPQKNIFSSAKIYLADRRIWKRETNHLHKKLKIWSEVTGIKLNNLQRLIILADNLYILKAHQLPLPRGLSNQDADEIISLSDRVMLSQFKVKELTHPMGHHFLSMTNDYFESAIKQKTNLKYVLYSAHESSILGVMNTLDSPLSKIPAYADRLNFSLMKTKNNMYYVKISYNDKPIFVPTCQGDICTMHQFDRILAS